MRGLRLCFGTFLPAKLAFVLSFPHFMSALREKKGVKIPVIHKPARPKKDLKTVNLPNIPELLIITAPCYVDREEQLLLQELQELGWQVPMFRVLFGLVATSVLLHQA